MRYAGQWRQSRSLVRAQARDRVNCGRVIAAPRSAYPGHGESPRCLPVVGYRRDRMGAAQRRRAMGRAMRQRRNRVIVQKDRLPRKVEQKRKRDAALARIHHDHRVVDCRTRGIQQRVERSLALREEFGIAAGENRFHGEHRGRYRSALINVVASGATYGAEQLTPARRHLYRVIEQRRRAASGIGRKLRGERPSRPGVNRVRVDLHSQFEHLERGHPGRIHSGRQANRVRPEALVAEGLESKRFSTRVHVSVLACDTRPLIRGAIGCGTGVPRVGRPARRGRCTRHEQIRQRHPRAKQRWTAEVRIACDTSSLRNRFGRKGHSRTLAGADKSQNDVQHVLRRMINAVAHRCCLVQLRTTATPGTASRSQAPGPWSTVRRTLR